MVGDEYKKCLILIPLSPESAVQGLLGRAGDWSCSFACLLLCLVTKESTLAKT